MIEKLKTAMVALESKAIAYSGVWVNERAIAAEGLRSVIAEMEAGEPVAWANPFDLASASINRGAVDTHTWAETKSAYHTVPLFTNPQPKAEPKPLPGADWTIAMRRMMDSGCSKLECTCKPENAPNCIWWDEPGDRPQPKAEPPKCVKCGDKLMSSFANTCYACNQKADLAPCKITTDGVCEAMECCEDAQPKKPLSVLQIRDIRDTFDKDEPISLVAFARAIEAAHGIK